MMFCERMNENRMQQAKIAKRNEFDISEEEERAKKNKYFYVNSESSSFVGPNM